MCPKEKAEKLVDKFKPFMYCYLGSGMLTNEFSEEVQSENAKQCVLMLVHEVLEIESKRMIEGDINEYEYWEEVKENL